MADGQVEWTLDEVGDFNSHLGYWWHGNGGPVFEARDECYTEQELREILRGLDLFRAAVAPVATPAEGGQDG